MIWTPEKSEAGRKMRERKMTLHQIAQALDVTRATVIAGGIRDGWLHAAVTGRRATLWTPQHNEIMRTMRAEGASWQKIANVIGVCKEIVRKHGMSLGLPTKKQVTPENERRRAIVSKGLTDGLTWEQMGRLAGVRGATLAEWAAKNGVVVRVNAVQPPPVRPISERGYHGLDPLPPGHPLSWGAISGGAEYPL